jgi:ABC-type phosphonate transport system ATPase subunit
MKPKLILMDEPFASLDAIVRARVVKDVVALVECERISARRGAVRLARLAALHHAKKWRRLAAPPSLGRKHP